ncbi:nicotinamide riboside transporter PnuC [Legionella nagasakiensis]|uniref:nicotinamide riboside transporter PnuC n=1 Tax=Legionella nagasakiensis TaxID=535290 RepID=UPI0010568432|nr:nicotinamide riboside transporter PnuC [Legionella nagasakiensis]
MMYDLIGAIASLLSTYYFIRQNNKAWMIALLATSMNGWLYWQKGIYADMCLESFYFLSAGYGWYHWTTSPKSYENPKSLTFLTSRQWLHLLTAGSILYAVIFYLLINHSHSTVARLDALTTSLSLIAQWLMCHKVIATWFLWFLADALYAFMYWQKELPFHALLMITYTGLAIVGYIVWLIRYSEGQTMDVPKV